MTYDVFGGTLNLTQTANLILSFHCILFRRAVDCDVCLPIDAIIHVMMSFRCSQLL